MADSVTSYIEKYKDMFGTLPTYEEWYKAELIDPYDVVVKDGEIKTYYKTYVGKGFKYTTNPNGVKVNKEVRLQNKQIKRLQETYGGSLREAYQKAISGELELTTQIAATDKMLGSKTADDLRKEDTKIVYVALAALVLIFMF